MLLQYEPLSSSVRRKKHDEQVVAGGIHHEGRKMQTTLTSPSSGQPCSEPHRCCWLLLVAQVIEALPKVADEVRGLVKEIKAGNASVTGVRIRTA